MMHLYDTAHRRLSEFTPPLNVRIYVCGVTPYDAAHLGHILTFMTFDLLQRRLEDKGHSVRMIRNITDVDEPIYARAAEVKVPYTTLAATETAAFRTVMKQLMFRSPAAEPKASEYIDHISAAVTTLREKRIAYQVGSDWYFDTATQDDFGSFSGYSAALLKDLMAARGGDPERAGKRQPLDFLLWKAVNDPHDPAAWESPLGRGRPGWHIECSVMSEATLGLPFDLHGGGSDLIFPHHECEIAQAHGLGYKPVAKHWVHVSPLILYGEKMSKSLGNLVFAKDVLTTYEPSVVRLALMNYHYRIGGEWRPEFLNNAAELLNNIRATLARTDEAAHIKLLGVVRERLDDDLDAPEVLCALRHFVHTPPSSPIRKGAGTALSQLEALLGIRLSIAR